MEQITFVESIGDTARAIGDKFWPGHLSIIFKHKSGICQKVRAGLDSVAVRIPSHPVARELLRIADVPVAAPSANMSGKPSPTCTRHVAQDFGSRIGGVVDGESCNVGVESTVIRIEEGRNPRVTILRPGNVTKEMLETVAGEGNVILDAHLTSTDAQPLAPGMKYRHYAPDVPLFCVDGADAFFRTTVESALQNHDRIGVMITRENSYRPLFEAHPSIRVVDLGSRHDVEEMCQNLFFCLRALDESDATQIFSEIVADDGAGFAFMNRLLKAASNQVIRE
jgi:L-threonylcarbamoyladenylate synthase